MKGGVLELARCHQVKFRLARLLILVDADKVLQLVSLQMPQQRQLCFSAHAFAAAAWLALFLQHHMQRAASAAQCPEPYSMQGDMRSAIWLAVC